MRKDRKTIAGPAPASDSAHDLRPIDRRRLLDGALLLGGGLAASTLLPDWARAQAMHRASAMSGARAQTAAPGLTPALSGPRIALEIGATQFRLDGKTGQAVTVNGTLPGPLIRLREGQDVRIAVTNQLDEDSSVHWHGLLVPFQMDGVPGVSFPGIRPGETFTYDFPVRQAGTYWYHSHSGMQEAVGLYGPIVIDPATARALRRPYDREYVIVLSDWSFMPPHDDHAQAEAAARLFQLPAADPGAAPVWRGVGHKAMSEAERLAGRACACRPPISPT